MQKNTILVIASDYYKEIYHSLLKECIEEISLQGLHSTETVTGVFEIPSIITFAKNKFDGYIALGCVIEEKLLTMTMYVKRQALMQLSVDGLALGYGILTCENYKQALSRASTSSSTLGKESCCESLYKSDKLET